MSARGFVQGRRPGTPHAKITDHEIKAEDVRLQTRNAQASQVAWNQFDRQASRRSLNFSSEAKRSKTMTMKYKESLIMTRERVAEIMCVTGFQSSLRDHLLA